MSETLQTRNVLIAVDVQNDFIDGSLAVNEAEQIVAPANEFADVVRSTDDGIVIYTRDWHPAETPHFDTWPVHCVQDTQGAEFHPALDVHEEDIVLSKGMGQTDGYSGMEGVGPGGETLETILEPRGAETVRGFFLGIATDYCVKSTVIDAAERFKDDPRVQTYLIRDLIRAVNAQPDDEAEALAAMEAAGAVALTIQEVREQFFEG